MLPVQIAGLALAGRTLQKKYGGSQVNSSLPLKSIKKYTLDLKKIKPLTLKLPRLSNPIEAITRGFSDTLPARINTLTENLSGAVKQVKKSIAGEDYEKAIKSYLPIDAKLVRPDYPSKSGNSQLVDIDGDSSNELVASYKLKNELRTMILKKQQDKWVKINEFSIPDYEEINFRGFADITGSGKKQLLLGLTSGKKAVLHGYSFDKGTAGELFSKNYHRLEVLPEKPGQKGPARLALWNRDGDSHKIEVLQWDGTGLKPLKDTSRYFLKRVVPYYVSKINFKPAAPENWYNLASALKNAGVKQDAIAAVNVGFKLAKDNSYKEKLAALKDEIEGKTVPVPKIEEKPPVLPEVPIVKQSFVQPGLGRRSAPRF